MVLSSETIGGGLRWRRSRRSPRRTRRARRSSSTDGGSGRAPARPGTPHRRPATLLPRGIPAVECPAVSIMDLVRVRSGDEPAVCPPAISHRMPTVPTAGHPDRYVSLINRTAALLYTRPYG